MTILIQKAISSDASLLADLACETFTDTFGHLYKPENLAYYLKNSCSENFFKKALSVDTILVTRDSDKLAGYIKYGKMGLPVQHGDNDVELHRLYVRKPYQGKGLGRELMAVALEDDFLKKADNIYLCVWENNFAAQRFYAHYGFMVVGECSYHVGTQTDRELVLRRSKGNLA